MLEEAKESINNWEAPSRSNKAMSRGKNWNMFSSRFYLTKKMPSHVIVYRMIEEFGEYLPEKFRDKEKPNFQIHTYHEKPIY